MLQSLERILINIYRFSSPQNVSNPLRTITHLCMCACVWLQIHLKREENRNWLIWVRLSKLDDWYPYSLTCTDCLFTDLEYAIAFQCHFSRFVFDDTALRTIAKKLLEVVGEEFCFGDSARPHRWLWWSNVAVCSNVMKSVLLVAQIENPIGYLSIVSVYARV